MPISSTFPSLPLLPSLSSLILSSALSLIPSLPSLPSVPSLPSLPSPTSLSPSLIPSLFASPLSVHRSTARATSPLPYTQIQPFPTCSFNPSLREVSCPSAPPLPSRLSYFHHSHLPLTHTTPIAHSHPLLTQRPRLSFPPSHFSLRPSPPIPLRKSPLVPRSTPPPPPPPPTPPSSPPSPLCPLLLSLSTLSLLSLSAFSAFPSQPLPTLPLLSLQASSRRSSFPPTHRPPLLLLVTQGAGDNTRLLGRAPEEEEEAMQVEGVREVAVATGLEVLYQETPNYRGAAAEADRMIEPRETARHAWRVPDLGVEPDVSEGEEAVIEGG
ncbi:unnamed protein product [Closterium sp. NIES-64]|nr:unnamed protein product [Closterium sp. NIES-64]